MKLKEYIGYRDFCGEQDADEYIGSREMWSGGESRYAPRYLPPWASGLQMGGCRRQSHVGKGIVLRDGGIWTYLRTLWDDLEDFSRGVNGGFLQRCTTPYSR